MNKQHTKKKKKKKKLEKALQINEQNQSLFDRCPGCLRWTRDPTKHAQARQSLIIPVHFSQNTCMLLSCRLYIIIFNSIKDNDI